MRSLRRVTAMLSLSLLLQPSLLAGVGSCVATGAVESVTMHGSAAHDMWAMSDSQDMRMNVGAPVTDDSSPAPAEPCNSDDTNQSCGGPGMPNGCATMTACASPPLAAVALASPSEPSVTRVRTPSPLALQVGIAASPESPPPRA